jgi:hypothetical protein
MLELFSVKDFEFKPQRLLRVPAPSSILTSKARPSCLAMMASIDDALAQSAGI